MPLTLRNPVLLRVHAKTGEVRGVSKIARSYPADLPTEERTFYLETDAAKQAGYARLLSGKEQSVDKSDGAAAKTSLATLDVSDRVRPDIVAKVEEQARQRAALKAEQAAKKQALLAARADIQKQGAAK